VVVDHARRKAGNLTIKKQWIKHISSGHAVATQCAFANARSINGSFEAFGHLAQVMIGQCKIRDPQCGCDKR
jgi:hypothetical protein